MIAQVSINTYMKFKQLNEALFKVDKVVDRLYEMAFARFVKDINDYAQGKRGSIFPVDTTMSRYSFGKIVEQYGDEQMKEAFEKNPIIIYFGGAHGSEYKPRTGEVYISFNQNVLDLIKGQIGKVFTYEQLLNMLSPMQSKHFKAEMSGATVRGTIAHELSHWMDDTLHNRHLKRLVNKMYTLRTFKKHTDADRIHDQGTGEVMMTSFERDAQIHAVKQSYREYSQSQWDQMTWNDLMDISVGVGQFYSRLPSKQQRIFKKNFIKRLHREGILGKRMR